MELIIVRHGRPARVHNVAEAADPPLTEIGIAQAAATARVLERASVDHVVTSPMLRARMTAAPLADALGLEPEVVDDLKEIGADLTHYVPFEELKAEGGDAWRRVVEDPANLHGDTDVDAFADTVTAAFERIIAAHPRRVVVAFCHGMTTMSYLRRLIGYTDPYLVRTDYAGITRIQASSTGMRTVRSVNETAHLGETRIVTP